jgi:hypothetical protein
MLRFRNSLQGYIRDERGVMLAEFLIMLPLIIWGFIALVVYWDVFRTINTTQKAAYSISDLLSRQEVITPDFVEGLQDVLTFLTPDTAPSRMRITSFEFNAGNPAITTDDQYVVLFSCSPEDRETTLLDQDALKLRSSEIPIMDNLDSMILVETWVDYTPDFDIGVLNVTGTLEALTLTQSVMTRPRSRRVCLAGPPECDPTCA